MTARTSAILPGNSRRGRGAGLKDEVYRQMFRLEESRPGAEMSLALGLLRAWLAAGRALESGEEREWLKKISPICLEMIVQALQKGNAAHRCVQ
jgi:hypothetical protein